MWLLVFFFQAIFICVQLVLDGNFTFLYSQQHKFTPRNGGKRQIFQSRHVKVFCSSLLFKSCMNIHVFGTWRGFFSPSSVLSLLSPSQLPPPNKHLQIQPNPSSNSARASTETEASPAFLARLQAPSSTVCHALVLQLLRSHLHARWNEPNAQDCIKLNRTIQENPARDDKRTSRCCS